jgi:hypothetical protein
MTINCPDYELLMYCPKWLLWTMKRVPHHTAMKLYGFYSGFPISWWGFRVWGAIMTTDYETTNRKTLGWTWYDEFYGILNRGYYD